MNDKIPFCPDCNSPVKPDGDGFLCPLDGLLHPSEVSWVSDYELAQQTPDDEDDDLDYCACGMGLTANGDCPSCDLYH